MTSSAARSPTDRFCADSRSPSLMLRSDSRQIERALSAPHAITSAAATLACRVKTNKKRSLFIYPNYQHNTPLGYAQKAQCKLKTLYTPAGDNETIN